MGRAFALALIVASVGAGAPVMAQVLRTSGTVASAEPGAPVAWRVLVDRTAVERGVAQQRLDIDLPDGRRIRLDGLRVVASSPDAWSVAGRVSLPGGSASAVLTFGPEGTYALLPTSDGALIIHDQGGVSVLRDAGFMRPTPSSATKSNAVGSDASPSDVALPPMSKVGAASLPLSNADQLTAHANGAVRIDVLGLISSELAGDPAAESVARTEFQHLLSVTNMAYADSGTNVEFRLVGMQRVTIDGAVSGRRSLDAITQNDPSLGVDVHTLRDQLAADLVALLRPFSPTASECGIAWLTSFGMRPDEADPAYGYSVTRTTPCSPFVLAHELGHNLGSMHDFANSSAGNGELQRGAYLHSHGLRRDDAPSFATVMAYETGSARTIGRFSDAAKATCRGVDCGQAGYMDNVASLRAMGPRVARFRDPAGEVTLAVGDVREGDAGNAAVAVKVRWATPAPVNGRRFRLRSVAGSASADSDFQPLSVEGILDSGETNWAGQLVVLGDSIEEPAETLDLVLEEASSNTELASTTIAIIDDDPKRQLSGALQFAGAAAPSEGTVLEWLISDAAGIRRVQTVASAPQYAWQLEVPQGARVVLERTQVAAPFAGQTRDFGLVSTNRQETITFNSRVRLNGRIAFPEGAERPSQTFTVWIREHDGVGSQQRFDVGPPDFAFAAEVRFGARPRIELFGLPVPWTSPASYSLGALTAATDRSFSVERGHVISGRLIFAEDVPTPHPTPTVYANTLEPAEGGNTQTSRKLTLDANGEFAFAARPGTRVWLDAIARPVTDKVRVEFANLRGDVRQDLILHAAPMVAGPVVYHALESLAGSVGHQVHIPIPLDRPAGSDGVFAQVDVVGGTASSADYALPGTVTAAAGARVAYLPVQIRPDALEEGTETAVFRLFNAYGVRESSADIVLNIHDQTEGPVLILPPGRSFGEGDTGSVRVPVGFSLDRPVGSGGARVRVGIATETSRWNMPYASEPSDISIDEPWVTFLPGTKSANFFLRINGDRTPEYNERFRISVLEVDGIAAVVDEGQPWETFSILNDDQPAVSRADRFVLPLNAQSTPWRLDVLANDADLVNGGFLFSAMELVANPAHGTAQLDRVDGARDDDDVVVYTPSSVPKATDSLRYRSCLAYGGGCSEGTVDIRFQTLPAELSTIRVASARGYRDVSRNGQPALTGARFETTPLARPLTSTYRLGMDATPLDAWDNDQGVVTAWSTLPPTPDAAAWVLFADAATAASGDIDLLMGIDRNGDGIASADELVCTAAMSATSERCDIQVAQTPAAALRWWVRLHNRGVAQEARLDRFEVPLSGTPGFVLTGPANLAAEVPWAMRLGWNMGDALAGESRGGAARVWTGDGIDLGWTPVRFIRDVGPEGSANLAASEQQAFALSPGQTLSRLLVDVPPGLQRLDIGIESSAAVDVQLYRLSAPTATTAVPLPRNPTDVATPVRQIAGLMGSQTLSVAAPESGQWFVALSNPGSATAAARGRVVPTLLGGPDVPRLRSGAYYNPARAGHGLFVYPGGAEWAGLWFTYRQDRSPTWYYLQGLAPAADGVWRADLYRSAWNGAANRLTRIGMASVAPMGSDTHTFTYTLDGETGSESLVSFGRGCPAVAGWPADVSGLWYDPGRAGSGYSVQMLPNYEFHALFAYDQRGEPRFLVAETPTLGGATARIGLEQLRGFCPLCAREAFPERRPAGTLDRAFDRGQLQGFSVDARFVDGVIGTWRVDDAVIPLGSTQGCMP